MHTSRSKSPRASHLCPFVVWSRDWPFSMSTTISWELFRPFPGRVLRIQSQSTSPHRVDPGGYSHIWYRDGRCLASDNGRQPREFVERNERRVTPSVFVRDESDLKLSHFPRTAWQRRVWGKWKIIALFTMLGGKDFSGFQTNLCDDSMLW